MIRRFFPCVYLLGLYLLVFGFFSWAFSSCASKSQFSAHTSAQATVFQYGSIDLLLQGAYDGQFTWGQVCSNGNLGLGTFEHLDGEAVLLDGAVWQVRADGSIRRSSEESLTPYATVVAFEPKKRFALREELNLDALKARLDRESPNKRQLVAFRIHGLFKNILTRSVPAQKRPYPALVQVVKNQALFKASNVSGTLVGFRSPRTLEGIRAGGYHLHFIADDRSIGGHVLDLVLQRGDGALLATNTLRLFLTDDELLLSELDENNTHSSEDLQAVEGTKK